MPSLQVIRCIVCLFVSVTLEGSAKAQINSDEAKSTHKVIHDFFEVLSTADSIHLRDFVTDDVIVLEDGEIWSLDTLRKILSRPRPADFKRLNSFEFVTTELSQTMCTVAYHNKATVMSNGQLREVAWLESAVLIKDANRWKIRLLHSTRLYVKALDKK